MEVFDTFVFLVSERRLVHSNGVIEKWFATSHFVLEIWGRELIDERSAF